MPSTTAGAGTGSNFLQVNATTSRTAARPALATEIYHTFGNGAGMTWFPSRDDQAVSFNDGNIADNESLTLWVRAPQPTEPLGSAANPFTSLTDASAVTTPGRYFFDLGGPIFDTYVDAQGWVRLALEVRDAVAAELPTSNSPPTNSNGMLSAAALASLTEMTEVRISSSVPDFLDARTANSGVIGKVLANQPIKSDIRDNDINTQWTGIGSSEVNKLAGEGQFNDIYSTLSQEIFHNYYGPNGGEGLHWIPGRGDMSLKYQEDIATGESFMLWARAQPASLPLLLQHFGANEKHDGVEISWHVYAANGGDHIDIQHSRDGLAWSRIDRQYLGVNGTRNRRQFFHPGPGAGIHYYRLCQTDYDGTLDFSFVVSVTLDRTRELSPPPYPNPATDRITLTGPDDGTFPTIIDAQGRNIVLPLPVISHTGQLLTLDVSGLSSGLYYVRRGMQTQRFIKR